MYALHSRHHLQEVANTLDIEAPIVPGDVDFYINAATNSEAYDNLRDLLTAIENTAMVHSWKLTPFALTIWAANPAATTPAAAPKYVPLQIILRPFKDHREVWLTYDLSCCMFAWFTQHTDDVTKVKHQIVTNDLGMYYLATGEPGRACAVLAVAALAKRCRTLWRNDAVHSA